MESGETRADTPESGDPTLVLRLVRGASGAFVDAEIEFANRPWLTLAGATRDDPTGQRLSSILPALAEALKDLARIVEAGAPVRGVERMLGAAAGSFDVQYIPYGDRVALTGHRVPSGRASDALESDARYQRLLEAEQQTQEALRASEERFRALFHNGPMTSVVYRFVRDAAGEIVDWEVVDLNAAGAASIGRSREDLRGQRALALFGEETMAPYLETSREVARTGVPRTSEEHFAHNDRDYLSAMFLVGDELYANVSIDITDLRRTQARLERAERLDLVGRLASGVAHDFNNLLVVVTSYAELIGETFADDDERREDVRAILDASTRASTLTRRLLVFGRSHAFEPGAVEVDGLVSSLGAMLRSLASDRVQLVLRPGTRAAWVRADRAQLEQVVVNLVVNARDAMPDGGCVTIGTAHVEVPAGDPRLRGSAEPGEYVRLTVADTGIGIDAATLAHIFEPFFSTKSVGKGTGLGLSIVEEAIARAGGFIAVESALGVGTQFAIHLRAAEPAVDAHAATEARRQVADGSETVLLVDDEPRVRAVTARLLRESGYSVVEAASAAIAVAIVERDAAPVDLLVTDVVMPGESGFDLAHRLTALRPGLPVLFISAHAPESSAPHHQAFTEGSYLAKPFTRDGLIARVRGLLEQRRALRA